MPVGSRVKDQIMNEIQGLDYAGCDNDKQGSRISLQKTTQSCF